MLRSHRHSPFFVLLILFVGLSACKNETPTANEKTPFSQPPTNELTVFENGLYAVTDEGLYRRPVGDTSAEWISLGMAEKEVKDVVFLTGDRLLVATRISDFGSGIPSLYLSEDGGEHWQTYMNNYGGEEGKYTWVGDMTTPSQPSDTVYSRVSGSTVVRSINGGKTWNLINGQWDYWGGFASFLEISPYHKNNIWTGGSNAIFQGYLIKSTNKGKSWEQVTPPVSATINDILLNPTESDSVLAATGYGIFRTADGGQNWQVAYKDIDIRTMAHSARNPETIYASGKNDSGTLFFAKSTDFGETWQQVQIPDAPSGIVVNDMISVMAGGQEVLYFGTNKGVFSYRPEEE